MIMTSSKTWQTMLLISENMVTLMLCTVKIGKQSKKTLLWLYLEQPNGSKLIKLAKYIQVS